ILYIMPMKTVIITMIYGVFCQNDVWEMEENIVSVNHEKVEQAVTMILEAIGEDPAREGLADTPKRVARMYEEVFQGLNQDPGEYLATMFGEDHEELVLVKDIPFYSMCEHHLLPFYGMAHIGYIPRGGRVTGLSKLARAVEAVAKRPQLQERLTTTVADSIVDTLNPHGVIVVMEAEHMYMTMRGVNKHGSKTVTSAVRGVLEKSASARAEAMTFIKGE